MKHLGSILLISLIFMSLIFGTISCGEPSVRGNSPQAGDFSTVVKMNGKELTVGAPGIGFLEEGVGVAVTVKNSGREPIALAELELVLYGSDGLENRSLHNRYPEEFKKAMVRVVRELAPGKVQTLYSGIPVEYPGSLELKVKRLE